MFVNKFFVILSMLLILFLFVLLLEYLKSNLYEGYMAVIGPVISPKEKTVNSPKNLYYENVKINQDFDPDSVLQDYSSNSILLEEDPEYILTN